MSAEVPIMRASSGGWLMGRGHGLGAPIASSRWPRAAATQGGAFHVPTGLPTVEEQVAQGGACFVVFIMMVIGISIGAAGLGVILRLTWRRIVGFFSPKRRAEQRAQDQEAAEQKAAEAPAASVNASSSVEPRD
ncbi:MAG: hypothetical protein KY438_11895 [Actinobacteria bacterium]|nr:hypothetical protein [Actinomycetota bacterium]